MLNNISGFLELLPQDQIIFDNIVKIIKNQFELYGFSPLDTPAVEKASTLLSKGNDNEIYGIHRLSDSGGSKAKDLALRFDLTVPLARYASQHYGLLTFPYRRYHIAPVFRGERPQAGRYRQFYQCDIDIVGDNELPIIYDAEAISVIYNVVHSIGLERFIIKINNRKILTGLIKSFAVKDESLNNIIRIIDKSEKISQEQITAELISQNINPKDITKLIEFISKKLSNEEWLDYLPKISSNQEFETGILELKEVFEACKIFGIKDQFLQICPALARGLNYYTGTICEAKLLDYPELGSVCGGGRYANLAENFSKKKLPGVGFSIGISRMIPKLIESGFFKAQSQTPAIVLVTTQNQEFISFYIEIANILRNSGINTEIYLAKKELYSQMKYANKKGFRFVIIADKNEIENNLVIIKDLKEGSQKNIFLDEMVNFFEQVNYSPNLKNLI